MDQPWFKSYESLVPHTLQYPDITLDSFLTESARKYPYNTASNFVLSYLAGGRFTVGGKLTYRKLNELADRFATALYQLGVRKGDRVALMLPNSPQFVIAFFATIKLGAIVVNNNPTYTARELKHQLEDSGAETIILLNLFWPRLSEVLPDTPVKRVIVTQIFDTLGFPSNMLVRAKQRKDPAWVDVPAEPGVYQFKDLLGKYPPSLPQVAVSPDDTALFQYTGGTTGLPKAAMLTHRNLVANTLQVASWLTTGNPGAAERRGGDDSHR